MIEKKWQPEAIIVTITRKENVTEPSSEREEHDLQNRIEHQKKEQNERLSLRRGWGTLGQEVPDRAVLGDGDVVWEVG